MQGDRQKRSDWPYTSTVVVLFLWCGWCGKFLQVFAVVDLGRGVAPAILPSTCSLALRAQSRRIWREAIVARSIHVKACASKLELQESQGAIEGASVHWGKVCPGGSHSSARPRERLGGLKQIGRTKFCKPLFCSLKMLKVSVKLHVQSCLVCFALRQAFHSSSVGILNLGVDTCSWHAIDIAWPPAQR